MNAGTAGSGRQWPCRLLATPFLNLSSAPSRRRFLPLDVRNGSISGCSDWYTADETVTEPIVKEFSAKYAAKMNITPCDCSKAN